MSLCNSMRTDIYSLTSPDRSTNCKAKATTSVEPVLKCHVMLNFSKRGNSITLLLSLWSSSRYSTLLSTIESLSLLLKIAQIPASRSLINRLVFSIEQRMEQLNQLVQLSSALAMRSSQRRDPNDDDFLSFRSALSSYEHLFTQTS